MEDKQLHFNRPLLSVRRSSLTASPEKDGNKKAQNSFPKNPRIPSYKSELISGPITNAGTVPFNWEHSPGQPKGQTKSRNHAIDRPPTAPKLPPGRIVKNKQQYQESDKASQSSDRNLTKTKAKKEDSPESNDGDEEFVDALDTLSRTDSTFLNCSVSGVSGLDSPDTRPNDPQDKDFMMGRFLPAAKAMASETPQHAPRKQAVNWERSREIQKVVNGGKQIPLRYGASFIRHYTEQSNVEESDDEYEEHAAIPGNICGLIPRFCLKGSVGFVNPVPTSMRTRASPASRSHVSSSSVGSCSEIDNEFGVAANKEQQSISGSQISTQDEDTDSSKTESKKLTSENAHKFEGSKLYSRLQGNDTIPSHNQRPLTFQELLADQSDKGETETRTEFPVLEKTLYVDTIHKVESPTIQKVESPKQNPDHNRDSILLKFRQHESMFAAKPEVLEDTLSVSSSVAYQDFDTSKAPHFEFQKLPEDANLKEFRKSESELPAPPPLPKSPSDSWLWRTLPTVTSKNQTSRLYNGARNIVYAKTTKAQDQYFRSSEELLVPIPES